MSPARPSSSCFLNISTPVQTDLRVSRKPTISTSSPTFTLPRSMRPVTTVPRPEIEKMSSIGIRKGRSIARSGCGTFLSTASISSSILASHFGFAVQRAQSRAADHRNVVARELVLRQQLAHFHLDQVGQLFVFDRVALVQEHHDVGHAHLAGQQNVLLGLRHRTVGRRNHQNRAVHLRRAGDHVLDVVGVAGAVDVRIVTVRRLVLHVRRRDRDAALALFRSVVDRVERTERVLRVVLLQYLRDRRRQRRLAVIDVTDRSHVHVRLRTIKLFLRHKNPIPFRSSYCPLPPRGAGVPAPAPKTQ